jgi:hypothetical protein
VYCIMFLYNVEKEFKRAFPDYFVGLQCPIIELGPNGRIWGSGRFRGFRRRVAERGMR